MAILEFRNEDFGRSLREYLLENNYGIDNRQRGNYLSQLLPVPAISCERIVRGYLLGNLLGDKLFITPNAFLGEKDYALRLALILKIFNVPKNHKIIQLASATFAQNFKYPPTKSNFPRVVKTKKSKKLLEARLKS